ncbi:MAG: RNA 2',3'-cyclic phosphodiesterase [bacterium]
MLRSFIALPLSKPLRENLITLIEELSRVSTKIKWVEKENLHITIRFLGDIDDELVKKISDILDDIAGGVVPFPFKVEGVGAFPHPKRARVIWAGVSQGFDEMVKIEKEISKRLEEIGIPKEEKAFHPHITIGRVKFPKGNLELAKYINESKGRVYGGEAVSEIILMKSTLTPKGSIYEPLHIATMKG